MEKVRLETGKRTSEDTLYKRKCGQVSAHMVGTWEISSENWTPVPRRKVPGGGGGGGIMEGEVLFCN